MSSPFVRSLVAACVLAAAAQAGDPLKSKPFSGVKANTGTVSLAMQDGTATLTLSDDFKIPDTPAPHWQIVDAQGQAFLLQRLVAKDDKFHKTITVPAHVHEIAKVQIWCAFAETLLGETAFDKVVVLSARPPLCDAHVSETFHGVKANKGTVTHGHVEGQSVLALSADFVIPDTPAPHWQVVDSAGRSYLLQRLSVKDGVEHRTITVPSYVPDVAKVQIWCAFAETLLGEASFDEPVM